MYLCASMNVYQLMLAIKAGRVCPFGRMYFCASMKVYQVIERGLFAMNDERPRAVVPRSDGGPYQSV